MFWFTWVYGCAVVFAFGVQLFDLGLSLGGLLFSFGFS